MKLETFQYPEDKASMYRILRTQLQGLTDGVHHVTANLANASALLNQALDKINWVGFYLLEKDTLVLGPFQGKPACIEIKVGNGVCGTAVAEDSVMLVKNVHEFPGHIACDSASNSEIVIPLHNAAGEIVGVLDIDSPHLARFDEDDKTGLTAFAKVLERIFA
ncbi:GAF domain-containing protein [Bariatricus massiliensis]|nr:GAF domain-containing protein [Bariatricus massiliensis]MDY2661844.1 GAF domain-containing protein [Bariatricus massiliensis]